jgi:hypothetical protein
MKCVQSAIAGFVAAIAAFACPASAADITKGRVVDYSFDNWTNPLKVPDASGKRNFGTPINFAIPPITEPGHSGGGLALAFDRQLQQRIEVGNGAAPSLDLKRFTIAAWVRITEPDTDEKNWEVMEKAAAYWLNIRNGHDSASTAYRLRCGAFINGKQYSVDSDIQVPHDGQWVHVAGSYNGSLLRVYIDGVQRGALRISGSVDTNDFPIAVGANNKPNTQPEEPINNWLTGAMDDFRLYNRGLSKAEIHTLATK